MTKDQLGDVFDRVRSWPEARQQDAISVLLTMEKLGTKPYVLSPEELAAVEEGLAQAERGEFASDAEVEATFRRFRR
jgi:predicted transcriptional regulator